MPEQSSSLIIRHSIPAKHRNMLFNFCVRTKSANDLYVYIYGSVCKIERECTSDKTFPFSSRAHMVIICAHKYNTYIGVHTHVGLLVCIGKRKRVVREHNLCDCMYFTYECVVGLCGWCAFHLQHEYAPAS